jgi:hypothetical protein
MSEGYDYERVGSRFFIRGIGAAGVLIFAGLLTLGRSDPYLAYGLGWLAFAIAITIGVFFGTDESRVTTDCHDSEYPALGDTTGDPHCWAGGTLQGVSVGANLKF